MDLLYVCMYQFHIDKDGVYTIPSFGDDFWKKYLSVFDRIHIIGEPIKGYLNKEKLAKLDTSRMTVELLPSNNSPQDWKNDRLIKRELNAVIKTAKAVVIKPASRKGVMAIHIAEKYNRPYMIEITGDLYTALKHHSNPLKRVYAPIINHKILHAIKSCEFGVYVTDSYLQKKYPIAGKSCGASDAVIKKLDESVFYSRLQMIKNLSHDKMVQIGLVGFYHDANKGIDTAIEALAKIPNQNICLNILGNGNEQDRRKWYDFASNQNINAERIHFPEPIVGIDNMFRWYDSMDIIILPSRSEGLPRTIVEAMSRACPCVTSNVCGLSELCESKWTHNPGDSAGLSRLLEEMLSDKDAMIDAAEYNFRRAEYYLESVQMKKRIDFMNEFKEYCEGI